MKRIRDLFRHPILVPAWTFEPSGIVWRILISSSGIIAGECRFQEEKRVSFFAIDERTGKIRWQNVSLPEAWWVGLEAVGMDIVLFHGFVSPDMPEHKGLYCHSLEDGVVRWAHPEISYWFHTAEKVYGLKTLFDRRVCVELDIQTGKIIAEHRDSFDSLVAFRDNLAIDEKMSDLKFPEPLSLISVPAWARTVVEKQHSRGDCIGESECILKDGVFIFNVYRRTKPGPSEVPSLRNELFIVTNEGRTLLHSGVIDPEVRYPVPDSFFVKDDQLLFVQKSRVLTAMRPWKS